MLNHRQHWHSLTYVHFLFILAAFLWLNFYLDYIKAIRTAFADFFFFFGNLKLVSIPSYFFSLLFLTVEDVFKEKH